jgi:RNA 2',3'-cyclic 3'-phosphodiesterase
MSEERARLFVALELCGRARRALVDWRVGAVEGIAAARVIRAEDLHVTLCFLGWQGLADVDAIAGACAAVAGRGVAALALGEAIWLPRRRPRLLAVAVEDLDGALGAAQGVLSEALAAGGWYQPEARPYLAHVTVARLARGARVVSPARSPAGPSTLTFDGSRVTLYRSRLSPQGARYQPLASISLAVSGWRCCSGGGT